MTRKHPRGKFSSPNAPPQTELDHLAPAPGVGVITGAQARGAVGYGAVGLVAGVLLGALLAFIPVEEWGYLGRLALFGGVGAFGGLVAGAVFGGGYEPETEGDVDIVDLRDGRQMRRRPTTDAPPSGSSGPASATAPSEPTSPAPSSGVRGSQPTHDDATADRGRADP